MGIQIYMKVGTHQIRCRIQVENVPREFSMAILNRLVVIAIPKGDVTAHFALVSASDEILAQAKVIDANVESLFIASGN